MKNPRPHFELASVLDDGSVEEPEIVPVTCMPWDAGANRRGFLGLGIAVAAAFSLRKADGVDSTKNRAGARQTNVTSSLTPTLKAHRKRVRALAVADEANLLASGSEDGTLKLWDLHSGELRTTLMEEKGSVTALAVQPGGRVLASGSMGVVRTWSLPEGRMLTKLPKHIGSVDALAFSPSGRSLAAANRRGINVWELANERLLVSLQPREIASVTCLAFSPDGNTLVSGWSDHAIRIWDLRRNEFAAVLREHTANVDALAISGDGELIASGSFQEARVWSLPRRKLLARIPDTSRFFSATCVTFSPDSKTLISGWGDKMVRFFSVPDCAMAGELPGHGTAVRALAGTADGRLLASGDNSGTIILWNLREQTFRSFLFDPAATETGSQGIKYQYVDHRTGQTVAFTLPCGSPVPPGAVCTCNCVPGTAPAVPVFRPTPIFPLDNGSLGAGTYCSCNKVCTCVPVYSH